MANPIRIRDRPWMGPFVLAAARTAERDGRAMA
jgi:hypothetical protein